MAYHNSEKFGEKPALEVREQGVSPVYFEERSCRWGDEKFRVMVPRPAFADLIMHYPAAGVA